MGNYQTDTFTLFTHQNVPLKATFYRATLKDYRAPILYLHGGGLMFGDRNDLPTEYIEQLTEAGYGILALDYLLAPESKLEVILANLQQSIDWFLAESAETLHVPSSDYYVMGRSAGGYLALYAGGHAAQRPLGVISLYGYFNLNEAAFNVPSRHFLTYQKVSDQMLRLLIQKQPLASAPMQERFPLYLAARQRGDWMSRLTTLPSDAKNFSLTKAQLAELPRTFIAAATGDQDVPVRQSKLLANYVPDSQLVLVDSDEHDFDRTQIETHGLPVYRQLVEWLLNAD